MLLPVGADQGQGEVCHIELPQSDPYAVGRLSDQIAHRSSGVKERVKSAVSNALIAKAVTAKEDPFVQRLERLQ